MESHFYQKRVAGKDVRFKKPAELFTYVASPPIVALGQSKAGKTVMALDIMHNFAKQARFVYYVSQTSQSFVEDGLDQIPSYCLRNPERDCYGCISKIWHDIKVRGEAVNVQEQTLKPIFGQLYPGVDVIGLAKQYTTSRGLSSREMRCAMVEICSRLLVDGIRRKPEVYDQLEEQEKYTVNAAISGSSRTLLILDDLSGIISAAQADTTKVRTSSGFVSKKEAMKTLLMDIFTRGRHYGALIVLFLHSLNTIDDNLKNNIQQYMFLDDTAASEVLRMTKYGNESREFLRSVINETQVFDKTKYPYHMLFYNVVTRDVAVTKADLHTTQIEVHPDTRAMHSIYDSVLARSRMPSTIEPLVIEESEQDSISIDGDDLDGI